VLVYRVDRTEPAPDPEIAAWADQFEFEDLTPMVPRALKALNAVLGLNRETRQLWKGSIKPGMAEAWR